MKKLLNPFVLVAEGFVMGACIFFATGGMDHGATDRTAQAAPLVEALNA